MTTGATITLEAANPIYQMAYQSDIKYPHQEVVILQWLIQQ